MAEPPSYYKSPSSKPMLGYWDIRGLGQPIRNMLRYAGVPYDEVLYGNPDSPDWSVDKPIQPTPFPNLPYFLDTNGIKLSQSSAIVRYLGRKHGLLGKTEEEMAMSDMCFEQVVDLRNAVVGLSYNPEFPLDSVYETEFVKHLDLFEKHAGTIPGKFIAGGDAPTVADFVLYEMVDVIHLMVSEKKSIDVLSTRPHLTAFKAKFEGLKGIKEYFASGEYKKRPINSAPEAAWY